MWVPGMLRAERGSVEGRADIQVWRERRWEVWIVRWGVGIVGW